MPIPNHILKLLLGNSKHFFYNISRKWMLVVLRIFTDQMISWQMKFLLFYITWFWLGKCWVLLSCFKNLLLIVLIDAYENFTSLCLMFRVIIFLGLVINYYKWDEILKWYRWFEIDDGQESEIACGSRNNLFIVWLFVFVCFLKMSIVLKYAEQMSSYKSSWFLMQLLLIILWACSLDLMYSRQIERLYHNKQKKIMR